MNNNSPITTSIKVYQKLAERATEIYIAKGLLPHNIDKYSYSKIDIICEYPDPKFKCFYYSNDWSGHYDDLDNDFHIFYGPDISLADVLKETWSDLMPIEKTELMAEILGGK